MKVWIIHSGKSKRNGRHGGSQMGDFTESMLLTLPNCEVQILDYIRIVIKVFYKAYKHIAYDGVEVMRDLQKAKGGSVLFPIVFTGMISENLGFESIDFFGKMQYEISQTPQVQLDCQVFEANGELKVVWDYRQHWHKLSDIYFPTLAPDKAYLSSFLKP